ncbi:MAG: hypothetical protein A3I12_01120 [Gammaproteobacteria bacterium RIFCSPLOWO2_02_FULL_38_11]|nr:MAG: hypothetical protein A3I12_01120 [Gammaproteobacteria bacterium RIFCSPLOWO2_02_FULL_38_11]
MTDYHILILGGGIVGLTLANLLAPYHLNIAVLENAPLSPLEYNPCAYNSRVSACNRASENIFRKIGIWESLAQTRLSAYKKMQIWSEKSNQKLLFDCLSIGEPNLGYIVENNLLSFLLLKQLKQYAHVHFYTDFHAKEINLSSNDGMLQNQDGKKIKFQLLVGADGKNSWIRKKLNFSILEKDYEQQALITHIKTEKPHQQTAYQRFLSSGPLAFLPLQDSHSCSIVWSTDPTHAEILKTMNKENFELQLATAFEDRLGKLQMIAPLLSFPLHFQHVKNYFKERVVLIGDAAHTIHPLAGLGLNLGLIDAEALSTHISHALKNKRDFGLEKTLRAYELQQKTNNTLTLHAINLLKNFFDTRHPLSSLSDLGLRLANRLPFIKNSFARYALGI